jgi:hypothetical protein
MGIGHYAALKFVTYSEATNAWTLEPVPTTLDPRRKDSVCKRDKNTGRGVWTRSHTYDSQFVDPQGRLFGILWRPHLHIYHMDEKKWSCRALPGIKWVKNCDMPAEYLPEMKGVLYVGRGRQLTICNPLTGRQRSIGKAPISMHGVMEYNPVHKVMLVAGGDSRDKGNRNAILVDGEGKITRVKPLPAHINCRPSSKLICDPVSGEYIIQEFHKRRSKGKPKAFAFHPVRNEWREIPGLRLPGGVAVPVSTHGVIMICTARDVYVYRHKPAWPDEVPGNSKK